MSSYEPVGLMEAGTRDREAVGEAAGSAEVAAAVRRERERLAEALHDDALQRVLLARQDLVEAEEEDDAELLAGVNRQLGEIAHSLRATTRAMHDRTLDDLPLPQALERLAADSARRGRLAVTTVVQPEATGEHDRFVIGLGRELLANVVRHAEAETVAVTVGREGDAIVLRVRDDGRGIADGELERAARSGHLGHARLRRTLSAVDGAIDIASVLGAGTTVMCTLPVDGLRAQRQLEESLDLERDWTAALVSTMQDGFIVLGGTAAQASHRLCAMTGFSHAELARATPDAVPFWPREGGGALAGLIDQAQLEGGGEVRAELLRRDGTPLPAQVSARAVLDDAGRSGGVLLTVKDLSATGSEPVGAATALLARLGEQAARDGAARGEVELSERLGELVRALGEELGWTVVACVAGPAGGELQACAAHGLDPGRWVAARGTASASSRWESMLLPRFALRGAYLIPGGERASHVSPPGDPSAWQDGDELLVPLRATDGGLLGMLCLEAPASGRRPADAELDLLVAVAKHAANLVTRVRNATADDAHARTTDGFLRAATELTAVPDPGSMPRRIAVALAEHGDFGRVIVELVGADGLLRPLADPAGVARGFEPLSCGELATLGSADHLLVGPRDELPAARRELQGRRSCERGPNAWDGHLLLFPLREPGGRIQGLIWLDDPADGLLPDERRTDALRCFAGQAMAALSAARVRDRLERSSGQDELTLLPNRRAFADELGREVARADRTGLSSMLVLVTVEGCPALGELRTDLDPAGIAGWQEAAGAFRGELRRDDRAFRIDGGLFAILLVGTERPPDSEAVTLRIAARLASIARGHGVTVHFGAAAIAPASGSAAEVLGRARRQLLERCRAVA